MRLPEVPSVSVRGLRVLLDDGSDMRIDVIVNMRDTTHGACRLNSFPGALGALLSCFVSFLRAHFKSTAALCPFQIYNSFDSDGINPLPQ